MIWTPGWIEYVALFGFGTMIGSFLNVVIYRVPADLSIVAPGSHCPQCKRPIKPWENIPLLSYILLRARCAGCSQPISMRYPLVEAAMGALLAALLFRFGWSWDLALFGVMTALALALSMIDFDVYRLPDPITLTGSILATVIWITRVAFGNAEPMDLLTTMVAGGAVGIGVLVAQGAIGWVVASLIRRRRQQALGLGDVKFAGMMGLFLGPFLIVEMFLFGVFLGALFGVMAILFGRREWTQRIPFGPYLALGALIALFWGQEIWNWYANLAHLAH